MQATKKVQEDKMYIQFYGVRGSYPVPGKNTIKYGGNTSCVTIYKEVEGQIIRLIIDCGTGLIQLGKDIVKNYFEKKETLNQTILFTHLHPDHIQAFPFFAPNFFLNASLDLKGMGTIQNHIGSVLEHTMLPPTFPIEYNDLKSKRRHFELKDKDVFFITDHNGNAVFEVKVMQSYAPSHPQQGCLYFRVTDIQTKKSVACVWDIESHAGGDKAVINFAKEADILIHDTQYTLEEYESDKMIVQGFGHSTHEMAIDNSMQAEIQSKLICTHFNPAHSDDKLDNIQSNMNKIAAKLPFEIILAHEEMIVEV